MYPGDGKITVNGKCYTKYFLDPWARWQIMHPLLLSRYTSTLNIDLWVYGGGFNGQITATKLAISKALVRFDPKIKKYFKKQKMLWSDPRKVERKKFGFKSARVSPVYKRR